MKTFADVKRTIKPGMKLKVVQHDYRPELTGTVRVVTRTQTNGYYFHMEGDSRELWSSYAKAGCYSFPTPDTYRQDESQPGGRRAGLDKSFSWTIQVMESSL